MPAAWTFYGRNDELGGLLAHMRRSRWFFGTIRGRRRIGKTALIQQAIAILGTDRPGFGRWLLLQVPDSGPADFATVFRSAVHEAGLEATLEDSHAVVDLPGVAGAVASLCRAGVTVVLDEFQVCRRGPLSGFPSLLQPHVDTLQDRDPVGGLVLLGSIQTEMQALLDDRQAPLFGRKTFDLPLGPWSLATVFEVARDHAADSPSRCLTLWTLLGGVPKYWRHFAEAGDLEGIPDWRDWAQQVCERLFLRTDSPLREEGEGLLGSELRRNYVAVLRTLAGRGPCTHADLQDAMPGLSLGPYLRTLTQDLQLIEKQYPIFTDRRQRRARYAVSDPFLRAWLSVIQPACQAARIQPAAHVAERLVARLSTLEGLSFERLVRDAAEEASRAGTGFRVTDRIRGYWNRPRTPDASVEIDFIAWNEHDRVVRFGSCKRSAAHHDSRSLGAFRTHVERFIASAGRRFAAWRRELLLFSPEFAVGRRAELEHDGWVCVDLLDFQRLLRDRTRGEKGVLPASPKIDGRE